VESLDEKIMRTIGTVLGTPVDQLVQTRSFTQNGGDSFAAIRVFQSLMAENVSLRVPDIMRAETIAELPALVISRTGPAPVPAPAVTSGIQVAEVPEVMLAEPENCAVAVATVGV
jgi:Phosphopantetheine attachment site